jgi:HEAT repeat protein
MSVDREAIRRDFVRIAAEGEDPFAATAILRGCEHEVVVDVVAAALAHDDASVRLSAVIAAREANVREAYDALVRLVHDSECEVQLEAICALGVLGVTEAWKPLVRALDEIDLRDEAARALGVLRAVESVPALAEAALGPREQVQISAIESLGAIGTDAAIAGAAAALDEERDTVVGAAARVVALHRYTPAAPKLLALLESLPRWSLARGWCANALGAIGDARAIEPLERIAADPALKAAHDYVADALAMLRER